MSGGDGDGPRFLRAYPKRPVARQVMITEPLDTPHPQLIERLTTPNTLPNSVALR